MGGLISYVIGLKYGHLINGIIMLAPAIMNLNVSKNFGWMAKVVGAIAPTLQLYPKINGRGAKNP